MITRTSISVEAAYETFRFALSGLSDPPKWHGSHAILAVNNCSCRPLHKGI